MVSQAEVVKEVRSWHKIYLLSRHGYWKVFGYGNWPHRVQKAWETRSGLLYCKWHFQMEILGSLLGKRSQASLGSWTYWQLSSGQKIQRPQNLRNWVEISVTTSNPPGRRQKRAKQIIRYQSKHPLLGNRTYRSKNFFLLFYIDCRYHIIRLNPSVCISKM